MNSWTELFWLQTESNENDIDISDTVKGEEYLEQISDY
jgi:hypothetical protein